MAFREFDGSLHLVTNEDDVDRPIEEIVEEAVAGGVTVVQLRDVKKERVIRNAQRLKRFIHNHGALLIIDNFVDVAEYVGADGVHLGRLDTPVPEARKRLGNRAIIGLTVETKNQALAARRLSVDYLGVSKIFESRTKPEGHLWGERGLSDLRASTDQYLVAIGGLNETNAGRIIAAGADGIAVVSAIYAAEDPRLAAQNIRAQIDAAKRQNT